MSGNGGPRVAQPSPILPWLLALFAVAWLPTILVIAAGIVFFGASGVITGLAAGLYFAVMTIAFTQIRGR